MDILDKELKQEFIKELLATGGYIHVKDGHELQLYRYDINKGLWEPATKYELKRQVNTFKTLDRYETLEGISWIPDDILDTAPIYTIEEVRRKSERHKPKVHFGNGTFDFIQKQRSPHDQENFFFGGRSYNLDEIPRDEPLQTELWFKDLFKEQSTFMMEFIGYCFFRSYVSFKVIVILLATNDKGKSLFFNWLSGILGQENVSVVTPAMLSKATPKELYTLLHGKDAVYYPDITGIKDVDTGTLNVLSGDDIITTQTPAGTLYNFRNTAKLIFGSNELPAFNPGSLKERVQFVEMNDIPNFDDYSFKEIIGEYGAFAFKCIQAFLKARKQHSMTVTTQMNSLRLQWLENIEHPKTKDKPVLPKRKAVSKEMNKLNQKRREKAQEQLRKAFEELSPDNEPVKVSQLAKVCQVANKTIYARIKVSRDFTVSDGLIYKNNNSNDK